MASESIEAIRDIEGVIQSGKTIEASRVRNWMRMPSIEVQSVLTDLLLEHSEKISPPLSMEEICHSVESYYKQCLIRNFKNNDRVPNRHIAGYELVRWFKSLWQDSAVPRLYLERLKGMLRDLYTSGEVPAHELTTAVLEHLFEEQEIQEFFAEWKIDAQLSDAFSLAKEWGDEHISKSN